MVLLPSFVRFLAATTIAAVSFINTVDGHGTEVRRCITPDGKLRFFVEHWHGDQYSISSSDTMTIRDDIDGIQITKAPDGIINDQGKSASSRWGCINNALPTFVRNCNLSYPYNDWVYYDYPVDGSITCNQPVSYIALGQYR